MEAEARYRLACARRYRSRSFRTCAVSATIRATMADDPYRHLRLRSLAKVMLDALVKRGA